MKKFFLLALLLVAGLVLVTGCGKSNTTPAETAGEPVSGSIEDLLKIGKNLRCEMQAKDGDTITSGTNYISGKQLRSDYQQKVGDQIQNGHIITSGDWMYSWNEQAPEQAIKLNLADMKALETQGNQESADLQNYNDKYDYKCYKWQPDQAKFTPPTNIEFIDYSAMLKGLQDQIKNLDVQTPAGSGDLCATCDSIPDSNGKASCKQSLGCK